MSTDTRPDAWQDDHDDRRADARTSAEIEAQLDHAEGACHGLIVDISFGGAKFVTRTVTPVLPIGAAVALVVTQSADSPTSDVSWNGTVVRSERSRDGGPQRIAYAIAFDGSVADFQA